MKHILHFFPFLLRSPNTYYYQQMKLRSTRLARDAEFRASIPLDIALDISSSPDDRTLYDDPFATIPMDPLPTLPAIEVPKVEIS